MAAAAATCGGDDIVLVPDPGYPDYSAAAQSVGAATVPLPLNVSTFQPEWAAVEQMQPTLLFLNYPSNPCGACAHPATFADAVAFAKSHGCWLAHDLAYGAFCYDSRTTSSILETPDASTVAVELWSSSKTFSLAGWRTGVVVGNADIVRRISSIVERHVAAVWPGFQHGLAAALNAGTPDIRRRISVYERRRDALVEAILAAGVKVAPPEGGLSIWCRRPARLDPATMPTDFGLAAVPGEIFGDRGVEWLRIALTVPDHRLTEAAERLARALSAAPQ